MTQSSGPSYIGGFFELDLPEGGGSWHPTAIALSTGRACMVAILRRLKPRRVRLPFYACDALFAPMREAGVAIDFYHLDERLLPVDLSSPEPGELTLAINYFGRQSALIGELARRYGRSFVADNTQAFFDRPEEGVWAFCSARKFFGVPDGAYLYAPEPLDLEPLPNQRSDVRHLVNRLIGRQQTAYRQVRRYERNIDAKLRAISPLSQRLLSVVDYEAARRRRRENYRALHALLVDHNLFDAALPPDATPFAYPLLLPEPIDRAAVARHRLYIPTLWEDVIHRESPAGFSFERDFAARLLPLPVDHRYTPEHMEEAVRRLTRAVSL